MEVKESISHYIRQKEGRSLALVGLSVEGFLSRSSMAIIRLDPIPFIGSVTLRYSELEGFGGHFLPQVITCDFARPKMQMQMQMLYGYFRRVPFATS